VEHAPRGRRPSSAIRLRRHPAVRTGAELTPGERAADGLRNGMGSWRFVFAALLFLAGWILGNGRGGFAPYPFILLNLILSCLAALQGAILLIAARRADQISSELAAHDFAADQDSEELIKEVRALMRCVHRQVGGTRPRAGGLRDGGRRRLTSAEARGRRSWPPSRCRPAPLPGTDQGPWSCGAGDARLCVSRRRPPRPRAADGLTEESR
jgi:uncharacterized membrane protein